MSIHRKGRDPEPKRRKDDPRPDESAPPPSRGEPGEFRADCRRQRHLLAAFREWLAVIVRQRAAGTWRPECRAKGCRVHAAGKAVGS